VAPVTAHHRPTTERIAIAVHEQTRGLRIAVAATVVVLAVGPVLMGHRNNRSGRRNRETAGQERHRVASVPGAIEGHERHGFHGTPAATQ
jgi:hypothetical protein